MRIASRKGMLRQTDCSAAGGVAVTGAEGKAGLLSSLKRVIVFSTGAAVIDILDDDGHVVFCTGSMPATGQVNVDDLSPPLFRAEQIGKGFRAFSSTNSPITVILEVDDKP